MSKLSWITNVALLLLTTCLTLAQADEQNITIEPNVCKSAELEYISYNNPLLLTAKQGNNSFNFDCNIDSNSVLTLPLIGINSVYVNINDTPVTSVIRSAKYSFVLSAGTHQVSIELVSVFNNPITIQLDSLRSFHSSSMSHNTVMSLYIGLCIALAMYVGLLGRGIKQEGFYAYSIYLVSIALFFGAQEGVFNYYYDPIGFLNSPHTQSFFAGIVVLSAISFISRLLDFKLLLNAILYKAIIGLAWVILVLGLSMSLIPPSIAEVSGLIMGWSTLFLVSVVFCISAYAAINRVHTAGIVVLAMSMVLFAMIFRIWLTDLSEFLNRYALIVSTAIESFLFAIAASEKVKYLEEERSRAYYSATQDSLCPVMNRRGWILAVKRKIDYYQKRGGIVVLQFIDLNDFKSLNDNYGHSFGDKVLQTFAKIIRHQAREDDVVGRLGGDEFVVFSHALSSAQAQRINQRFDSKLANLKLNIDNRAISLTASVGCVALDAKDANLNRMLEQADIQMYQRKKTLAVS